MESPFYSSEGVYKLQTVISQCIIRKKTQVKKKMEGEKFCFMLEQKDELYLIILPQWKIN